MLETELTRRSWLAIASATAGAGVLTSGASRAYAASGENDPFLFGLNTSTIRGQNLPLTTEAELAAKTGFGGIEPWIRELDDRRGQTVGAIGPQRHALTRNDRQGPARTRHGTQRPALCPTQPGRGDCGPSAKRSRVVGWIPQGP